MTDGPIKTMLSFSPELAARLGFGHLPAGEDGLIAMSKEDYFAYVDQARRGPAGNHKGRHPSTDRAQAAEGGSAPAKAGGIAAEHLRQFIARIEKLEEEKKTIGEDLKEVYAEAKGNGFDTKIIRQIVRLRKQEEAERQEQEALLDLYKQALGMI